MLISDLWDFPQDKGKRTTVYKNTKDAVVDFAVYQV